ncbi:phosphoglycerate mutase-like protein [Dermatophagoides farinae]|uniref:Fructose-2,6-bisphosphatase TIGAR n=1 Tax=Dermatophagoides farinae TaxID=6954 RepID=A0A9D4SKM2_DERFA|nr:fructose-2,6-bisphosphatase TIGAR-like [Dermatophagoides farinae]XP_046918666.1 fructose-2,6-bisphosphatase TIGAR-like [Dermatophagoides farinae]KAH7645939.1 phosphoglycerate mutase-like protein [Dermatophagoides farinae]
MSPLTKVKFPSFLLTLIRHGETNENNQAIVQGQKDTKLNETGRKQSQCLAKNFDSNGFNRIYASDLSRAYDTCTILLSDDSKCIITDPLIRERSFGEKEGRPLKELVAAARNAGLSTPEYIAKGGESLADVQKRVIRFLQEKILLSTKPDEQVLIVSHGGVIRQMIEFLAEFMPMDLNSSEFEKKKKLIPPNTSVTEFRIFYCPSKHQIESVECMRLHEIEHLDEKTKQHALNQPQINAKVAM